MNNVLLIEQFLAYLEIEKRLSPHTLVSYQRDLKYFCSFLEKQKHASCLDAHASDIRKHISERHKSGLKSKSVQRELSAIRRFYRFLISKNLCKQNPAQHIKPPKHEKKLPKLLDVDEVFQLLETEPENPLEVRDLAMFELFYSSGLRLSELANLDLTDINLKDASVLIRKGKGNKQRLLPLGSKAISAIQKWLQYRENMNESALFLSKQGKRLGQRSIQLRLKRWGEKNSAFQHIHPHMLRHSFASHMLETSQDIRAVQELLGHSNISTTQIYTHLDFQHLASVYDKTHPKARKKSD